MRRIKDTEDLAARGGSGAALPAGSAERCLGRPTKGVSCPSDIITGTTSSGYQFTSARHNRAGRGIVVGARHRE